MSASLFHMPREAYRYAHKWVDYAIEAVCNFTPSGEEDCDSYDTQGNPTYGRLGTDRPHQFKVQGTYDLPYRDGFNVADATFFGGFNPVAVASAQNFRPDPRSAWPAAFRIRG